MTNRLISSVKPPDLSFGIPERPTIQELVSIAAQIAQPDESPRDAAERAIDIFEACRARLIRRHKDDLIFDLKQKIRETRRGIEESLEARPDGNPGAFDFNELAEFLGAGTKPIARKAVSCEFFRYYIGMREAADGVPESRRLQGSKLESAAQEMLSNYESNGVPIENVLGFCEVFSVWHKDVYRPKVAQDKAYKSKRSKLLLPICRKILDKTNLADEEEKDLGTMTEGELSTVMKALQRKGATNSRSLGILKAAIESAKTPKSARPKRVKKSDS